MPSRTSSSVSMGVAGLRATPALRPSDADQGQVLVEMGRGLDVEGDPVGPGFVEQGDEGPGVLDHEMDVDGQARLAPDGRDELGAEGQVGHEVPVHDVDVDEVGPGRSRPA